LLPVGPDDAAFRLADDLGGNDDDVAVGQHWRGAGDQRGQVGAAGYLWEPGHPGDGETRAGSRACGRLALGGPAGSGPAHPRSSPARSSAARAISAVAARSVIYSGSARTVIPGSAGPSTAALSWSSTSQPLSNCGP